MKKLVILFAVLFAFSLTACTDLISEDDETIFQTQAIDKDDIQLPGEPEEEDPDDTES